MKSFSSLAGDNSEIYITMNDDNNFNFDPNNGDNKTHRSKTFKEPHKSSINDLNLQSSNNTSS